MYGVKVNKAEAKTFARHYDLRTYDRDIFPEGACKVVAVDLIKVEVDGIKVMRVPMEKKHLSRKSRRSK